MFISLPNYLISVIPKIQSLIKSEYMFDTGDKPLLITCSDLEEWVCKHGRLSPSVLFNEVLGSVFALRWNLKTPRISYIEVDPDHLPEEYANIVQPAFFKKPCFGSYYLKEGTVIDKSNLTLFRKASFRKDLANKEDLLKIALFDIWLSNEDRNAGNSNLMLDYSIPEKFYFTVFDHGAIFNSNSLSYGLELITEDESLISTDLFGILFKRTRNLNLVIDNIIEDFYLCVERCKEELPELIKTIPQEWNLDLVPLETLIERNLFDEDWNKRCITHFRTLLQVNLN